MPEKSKRRNQGPGGSTPRSSSTTARPDEGDRDEQPHVQSPTAVAGEALSTGVRPPSVGSRKREELPRDGERMRVGDVDADALQNALVGDEAPGGDMATPDQDLVDEIGRAYGVQEADSGALRASSELLDARDRRRARLEAPRTTHGTRDDDRNRNR